MNNSQEQGKDQIKQEQAAYSGNEVNITGRREELLNMLLDTIKNSENFPPHVRHSFVTYLDLEAALTLIYAILKEFQG